MGVEVDVDIAVWMCCDSCVGDVCGNCHKTAGGGRVGVVPHMHDNPHK